MHACQPQHCRQLHLARHVCALETCLLTTASSLQWALQALDSNSGPAVSKQQLQDQIAERIASGGGRVDYVEVVDAAELQRCADMRSQPTLIAVAAFFGKVRLIDNAVYTPAASSPHDTGLPAQSQPYNGA